MAQECDVPYDFINGLWNIYVALTSQLYLIPSEFGKYCKKILGIYFNDLNWYRMIPSVHKILVHGEELLEELYKVAPTIAPGQLSEEPSEHFNKFLKNDEIAHAPQHSRKERLKAMSTRGIERSDVLVRSYEANELGKRPESDYPFEVRKMRRFEDYSYDEYEILEILEQ